MLDLVLKSFQFRGLQLERLELGIVEGDRQARRQPEGELVVVERGLQSRLCLEQGELALQVALQRLIDLDGGDALGLEERFVHAQVLLLALEVGLQVADVLHLEEQGQVAIVLGRGERDVELLAEAGEVADGVEDVALGLRQRLQADPAAGAAQQRLRQGGREVGGGDGLVDAGEGNEEAVGDLRQELSAGVQVAREAERRGGVERVDLGVAGAERRPQRVVGEEPVAIELEAVERQTEGGQVQGFERRLILAAVEQAQFDGLFRRQFELAVRVQDQRGAPGRILDKRSVAVVVKVARAADAVGAHHEAIGGGIVGRQGRMIGVEWVEKP